MNSLITTSFSAKGFFAHFESTLNIIFPESSYSLESRIQHNFNCFLPSQQQKEMYEHLIVIVLLANYASFSDGFYSSSKELEGYRMIELQHHNSSQLLALTAYASQTPVSFLFNTANI